MNEITEHEAREQLARAAGTGLESRRDRLVHGWATAGFGTLVALYFLLSKAADDRQPWESLILAGYVVLLVGLALVQKRAANTVPRNSRKIGVTGVAASAVLGIVGLGVVSFWDAWWVYVACLVVVAAPSLVAGAVIARGGRR